MEAKLNSQLMECKMHLAGGIQYNDTNDSSSEKLIYNSAKQLIQQKSYEYSTATGSTFFQKSDYTYDNNGNVLKEIETNAAGNTNLITTFTYTNIVADMFSLSTIYHPQPYKNLLASKVYFTPSGNTTQTVNFTYTFDSNNRITTETQTVGPGIVGVQKFIYY